MNNNIIPLETAKELSDVIVEMKKMLGQIYYDSVNYNILTATLNGEKSTHSNGKTKITLKEFDELLKCRYTIVYNDGKNKLNIISYRDYETIFNRNEKAYKYIYIHWD